MSNDGFDEAADTFKRGLEARMVQVTCMMEVLDSLRVQDDGTQPVPGLLIEVYAWITAPCVILTTPLMREDDHVSVSVELDRHSPEPGGEAGATMTIRDDGPAGGVAGLFEANISMARQGWRPLATDLIRRTIADLEGSALKAGEAKTVVTTAANDEPAAAAEGPEEIFFGDAVEEEEPEDHGIERRADVGDQHGMVQLERLRAHTRNGGGVRMEDDHGDGSDAVVFAETLRRMLDIMGPLPTRSMIRSMPGEMMEKSKYGRLLDGWPSGLLDANRENVPDEDWCLGVVTLMELLAARMRYHSASSPTADRGGAYSPLFSAMTAWSSKARPGYIWGLALDHDEPEEGWAAVATARAKTLTELCDRLDPPDVAPAAKVVDGVVDLRSARPSRRSDPPNVEDDALDEDWDGREKTSGRVGVIISGVLKPKARERLRRVLDLESLDWVTADDAKRVKTACKRIENGSFEVVIQTVRWVNHSVNDAVTRAVKKAKGAGLSPLLVRPQAYGHTEVRHLLEDVEPEETTAAADAVA